MNVGFWLACAWLVRGGNVVVSQQQRPSVVVASGFLLPRGGEADGEQTVQVKFVTPFWRVQVKFDTPVSASRQIRYIFYSFMLHAISPRYLVQSMPCPVVVTSISSALLSQTPSSYRLPLENSDFCFTVGGSPQLDLS